MSETNGFLTLSDDLVLDSFSLAMAFLSLQKNGLMETIHRCTYHASTRPGTTARIGSEEVRKSVAVLRGLGDQ